MRTISRTLVVTVAHICHARWRHNACRCRWLLSSRCHDANVALHENIICFCCVTYDVYAQWDRGCHDPSPDQTSKVHTKHCSVHSGLHLLVDLFAVLFQFWKQFPFLFLIQFWKRNSYFNSNFSSASKNNFSSNSYFSSYKKIIPNFSS